MFGVGIAGRSIPGSGRDRPGGRACQCSVVPAASHRGKSRRNRTRKGDGVNEAERWRGCSVCKAPIPLGGAYWVCNVSTCNRKRTGLVFCSVDCWDVHLPDARHRESWAVEKTAPRVAEGATGAPAQPMAKRPGKRRMPAPAAPVVPREAAGATGDAPQEILIVASRLKDYVRARSGYNTSDRALGPLSDIVRRAVDEAIRNAGRDERKTVLDRDIPKR